jgi:hypothetical protein
MNQTIFIVRLNEKQNMLQRSDYIFGTCYSKGWINFHHPKDFGVLGGDLIDGGY